MKKLIIISCLLFGFAGTALHAQTEDEKIREIIKLSGIRGKFENIASLWNSQFVEFNLEPEKKAKFKNVIQEIFNPDSLLESYYKYYVKSYDKEKIDSIFIWHNSPLASIFQAATDAAQSPDAQDAAIEYFKNLNLSDTSNQRLQLSYKLEATLNSADLTLKMTMNFMRSFLLAMNPTLPEDQKITENQLNTMLGNYEWQMRDYFKKIAVLTYQFSYRDISLEEYEEYIKFYRTETGIWENQNYMSNMTAVLKEVMIKFAIALRVAFPEENAQSDELEF